MRRPNAWYGAICEQLRIAGGPLAIKQIWAGMEASGFQHSSKWPRSTLGARVAELVQLKRLVHVGPGTYQIAPDFLSEVGAPVQPSSEVAL